MEPTVTTGDLLIARLKAYEAASNRHDIDAAVAMFTADGVIEVNSKQYGGSAVLRAAHEYDMATNVRVRFGDFRVENGVVRCRFVYCDALDRAVGLDGTHAHAEFTFQHERIRRFVSLPADETELLRHRTAKAPFFAWARQHYPDEVAKRFAFDYETGASLMRVVQAWCGRGRDADTTPAQNTTGA